MHCIPPLLTLSPLPHQGKLDEERQQVMLLRQNQEHVEDDLRGLRIRNREYEEGLYGLPQVCVNGRGWGGGRGLYGPPWEEEAQAWDGGRGGGDNWQVEQHAVSVMTSRPIRCLPVPLPYPHTPPHAGRRRDPRDEGRALQGGGARERTGGAGQWRGRVMGM